ncbi:MAG: class I SAM-dependent methyltransferase [Gammaproteobacteria bacterium]|nr:class I SAM-dependent methyltransferase [Gammaproteobacteria bacterium]
MQIPWWAKLCAKMALSRLPFGYSVWQKLGLFRHGNMDAGEYAIRIFQSHMEKSCFQQRLAGKTILELGPGDSLATAIIAAGYGARSILIDSGRFIRKDINSYVELVGALAKRNLPHIDISCCRDVDEILELCNSRYMTEGLDSLRMIEKESVDLIFSQAVLEHIRRYDFLETMRECRRILREGGVCSHQVDLRDHLGGSLNNLRFSERVWESAFFSKSGFYTNRIQYSEMIGLFAQAGFKVEVTDICRWDTPPTRRSRLSTEFIRIPDEELCISMFDVLLR